MDTTDPDFARLLRGDARIDDLPVEAQRRLHGRVQRQELSLDDIPDPTTRETMKRWARYFPE